LSDQQHEMSPAPINMREPLPPPKTLTSQSAPVQSRFWLWFGTGYALVAVAVFLITFLSSENSCDRWTLLRFMLPMFSGIAAGAFAGSLSTQGPINQIAFVATGGFGVWLLTLLLVPIPDRCNHPIVTSFRAIENDATNKEGTRGQQIPKELKEKSGVYDSSKPDLALFLTAVVDNIWTGPNRQANLLI
jgi:hypothetical protein